MKRFLWAAAALLVLAISANAQCHTGPAQLSSCPSQRASRPIASRFYQPMPVIHRPNVDLLDQYADQLEELARHLHNDAHELGQDYDHSEAIEAYVQQLDRNNTHLHQVLHQATVRRHLSHNETLHVRSDVIKIRQLLIQLDGDLRHQRIDGVRPQDFHALDHMRQILANQMYPLTIRMEQELGYQSVQQPVQRPHQHETHRIGYRRH